MLNREMAAGGPSIKGNPNLVELLSLGGTIENEKDDGECFYRAVARQTKLGKDGLNPEDYRLARFLLAWMYNLLLNKKLNKDGSTVALVSKLSPEQQAATVKKVFDEFSLGAIDLKDVIKEYYVSRGEGKLKYTAEESAERSALVSQIEALEEKSKKGGISAENEASYADSSAKLIALNTKVKSRGVDLGIDEEDPSALLALYAELVRTTTIWGGQIDAKYLAIAIKRDIIWYDITYHKAKFIYSHIHPNPPVPNPANPPVVIAWHGGNHYQSILPPAGGWKEAQLALLYKDTSSAGGGRRRRRTRRLKKSK